MNKFMIIASLALMSLLTISGCDKTETKSISTTPSVSEAAAPVESVLAQDGYLRPEIPRVTAEGLYKLTQSSGDITIIDTRDEFLFKEGHIPGAINIPWIASEGASDESTRKGLLGLADSRLKVFYCDCPHDDSSALAAYELISAGYQPTNIKVLWKGYFRWEELGYSVEKQ
jgi:rhodanese-related sulfurtransferase